jgi:hypothetical protein
MNPELLDLIRNHSGLLEISNTHITISWKQQDRLVRMCRSHKGEDISEITAKMMFDVIKILGTNINGLIVTLTGT